ncbi:thermonuclease family protein [Sphingopyxis sp. L1A2A]|uniref:thermonuclease family protein n=1 Tax=Sphingopyxis sp. L1A2A TaxID=2502247 RepID=UPI00201675C6|nr:thermonuclease family protein [Sphingopyxis sp. L1A2A]
MKWFFVIALALTPLSASAQVISRSGRAMDGDSLNMAGIAVRLHGVDAPELNQTCARGGQSWACGKEASAKLAQLVNGAELQCEQRDVDDYDRIVASCADSDDPAQGYRHDHAHRSDLIPRGIPI